MGASVAREMRELERVQHRYDSRTGSVARQFDRICNVLNELGYLDRLDEGAKEHIDYRLTERGQLSRHLYSELDLVLAQRSMMARSTDSMRRSWPAPSCR